MVLVDSSVWIDYFNGKINTETNLLDNLLDRIIIITGDLIYIEVLQGFSRDSDFRKAKYLLDLLPFKEMVGKNIALKSIFHYRQLRKNGVTVRKTIDVLIGTFCIVHNIPLLHSDRDFVPMEEYLGLKTIQSIDDVVE